MGVWLFGNDNDEILTLGHRGERDVHVQSSGGSPFARALSNFHGGGAAEYSDERRTRQQRAGPKLAEHGLKVT
ncbi:hypothetical protein LSCM1_01579 [Leishmania martiniquensis]|uniref:Uncharacterized protein n=1 Tax=Leishmania martiniquensis TaxID=1580590 RepID=A0A836KG51_9TRYP|nr:hypothetical protein LSCM1_01579 [Leishmania martiniquensis]